MTPELERKKEEREGEEKSFNTLTSLFSCTLAYSQAQLLSLMNATKSNMYVELVYWSRVFSRHQTNDSHSFERIIMFRLS